MTTVRESLQTASLAGAVVHRNRWRRRAFVLCALLLGLLPIVLLELALRGLGVAEQVDHQDPLVGFSRVSPLFELDADEGVYHTNRSRLAMFNEQAFAAVKADHGLRIFCLGGSTVRGHPYETPTAFARWIEVELSHRNPSRPVEVINCGGLSYASYRLLNILKEVLTHQPDLIVVATGHNEFLEDRTYGDLKSRSSGRAWIEDRLHDLRLVRVLRQSTTDHPETSAAGSPQRTVLPDEVAARLDHHTGYAAYHRDDAWARGVVEHFDRSLRTMVELCRQADVPLILVELGSNVRDCPPFKSEHRPGLSAEEQQQWEQLFEEATAYDDTAAEKALAVYQQAAEIDDEYALLNYRVARCLDRLGRIDEAREAYLKAKDSDVCPLRMTEEMTHRLKDIATETATQLIPARATIEAQIATGMAGNDWYLDHVHPSILAHQLIAGMIVEEMQRQAIVSSLDPWTASQRRRTFAKVMHSLGPLYLHEGTERLMWLENWARRQRLTDETRPQDPHGHLRFAWRMWDLGQQQPAIEHLAIALSQQPDLSGEVLDRAFDLFRQGRGGEAAELLGWLSDQPQSEPQAELIAALIEVPRQDAAGAPPAALVETLTPFTSAAPHVVAKWLSGLSD